jgi:putative transposase
MEWARVLAYITGTVDQERLLWNACLLAESRVLKAQLPRRLRLSDTERATLGEIGHRLGRKALGEVATAATPDTILAWYRKLMARKFDGSRARRAPGRPPIDRDLEDLIVRMARENRSCGYDRIVGAQANRGHAVSDQATGNALRRHGIPPAPDRKRRTTWAQFIRVHLAALAGTDFLYGGGPHVARTGDLLRAVLHPSRAPQSCYGITDHPNEQASIFVCYPTKTG